MGNLTAKTSGEIASFMTPAKTNIKSLKVHFSPKQLGTGDPSPENVREIEGWDGVNAYNDPKYSGFIVWNQLYNYGGSTGTNGGIKYTKLDNGTWEVKGTSDTTSGTAARRRQIQSPSWKANHVYWFSARAVGEGSEYVQMVLSNSGSIKKTTTLYNGAFVKPTEKINQFSFRVFTQNVTVDVIARPQIIDLTMLFGEEIANYIYNLEKSKSDAGIDYFLNLFPKDWYEYNAGEITTVSAVNNEPYTNLSIDWSSNVGTVYGGYVDLISGELVEEIEYQKMLSTWTWRRFAPSSSSGEILYIQYYANVLPTSYANIHNRTMFCNIFKPILIDNRDKSENNKTVYRGANSYCFRYDEIDTIEEWVSYINENDIYVADYLVEPITHQLTPTQLKSFVGQNNFWSNADYVEVEYDLIETIDIQKTKQKITLNQPQLKTVFDKVVSFNTDMVAPIKNCKIYFKPIQLGSGNPSPTNVRDINGWTGIDSYVNGDKVSVDWTNDAGTIYGGYLDLAKGEVVAEKDCITSYNGETLTGEWISDRDIYTVGNTPIIGAKVVYILSEPIHYPLSSLTSQQFLTLKSTNNIWSETNGQQIDVKYWTHKNLTPTPLINYLENQTWTDSAYISSSGKKTTNTVSASHFLTNQILLEAGTYVLSGFSYYAGSDSTRYRIHAYDSTGKWVKQITFQEIDNLSPVDISFTLDTDTYVNVSIAMDFDGVLAKIN